MSLRIKSNLKRKSRPIGEERQVPECGCGATIRLYVQNSKTRVVNEIRKILQVTIDYWLRIIVRFMMMVTYITLEL